MKKLGLFTIAIVFALNISCNEKSKVEKLEDEMETHVEDVEQHAENIREASEYVEEGFDDLEEAIENFREALENIEDEKERQVVRERIIKIMDDIDLKKSEL